MCRTPRRPRRLATVALALALALPTAGARSTLAAQDITFPHLDWQTVETTHFTIHYPRTASAWTLDMASRIESVYAGVSLLVGNAPRARITVIVEDPYNVANGFAIPFLDAPLIFLWPTPPDPASGIGDNRGWSEILIAHEYTHIAHLTRPSRNPVQRFLTQLSPVMFGPLAIAAPRWITEGYATYIEGRLTGSGRPHSAWRAAVLRQWALEGQLPTYGQLDSDARFYGGSMAYLVGSAYLEWLVQRSGDSSLVHLWRRMSARRDRTFDDAFAGVFGGPPAALYGRFTAELTERALVVEQDTRARLVMTVRDSGAGRTVQRLEWNTGAPAVSRDGSLLALVLTAKDKPSRVVVWHTGSDPKLDSAAARARRRELALDPEDVPAIDWRPRPKRPVAVLYPHGGLPFSEPRFLPDGHTLLLVRATGRGDGAERPDLFLWNFHTGAVRRLTHGASIEHADPSPDGRFAVGDRCIEGVCDLVRVTLASGHVVELAAGAPGVQYYRPRYSPDGHRIAVSMHVAGRWRVALVDADGDTLRGPSAVLGRDSDANRYDPDFLPDGNSLVVTSDAGGIPDLERYDLRTGATHPLTRVTGAALAPAVDPRTDSVYFLRLHATGFDLNVTSATDSVLPRLPGPFLALAPASPTPAAAGADTFSTAPVSPPHGYGAGPRQYMVLPSIAYAAEGKSFGAMFSSTDPVGRLTWVAQGLYGDRGTWRGGTVGAAWRGARPTIGADVFYTQDRPSDQHGGLAGPAALDVNYTGATLHAALDDKLLTNAHTLRLGASLGRLDGPAGGGVRRALGFASYDGAFRQTPGEWSVVERAGIDGAAGRTGTADWSRGVATLALTLGRGSLVVEGEGAIGVVDRSAPAFEQFTLGGIAPPFLDDALLAERVAMPALPVGVAGGSRFATYRVALPGHAFGPYYWAGSAGATLGRWQQVVGADWSYETSGVPYVRLPGVRVVCGIGYSLTGPVRHQTQGYLTIGYRP